MKVKKCPCKGKTEVDRDNTKRIVERIILKNGPGKW
jgi:hypothetical protein